MALAKIAGGERVDSTRMKDPIIAFVFDIKGFMQEMAPAQPPEKTLRRKPGAAFSDVVIRAILQGDC